LVKSWCDFYGYSEVEGSDGEMVSVSKWLMKNL